ncbi:MAG: hypothetical protein ABIS06_21590 [Vicinamibacterales bacterium]
MIRTVWTAHAQSILTAKDYGTAVIWRCTGHFSGKGGWEKEPVVRIPYPQLPEAEKVKDRPVWQAGAKH